MRKLIFCCSAIAALLLTGCDREFTGTLSVLQPLSADNNTTIEPGNYAAEIEVENRREFDLTVRDVSGDNDARIRFRFPEGLELPEENGSFRFTPEETGLPFYIAGSIATEVSESETRREQESCTRYERECYPTGGGGYTCRDRPVPGWQEVEYFVRTTEQDLLVDLADTENVAAANFAGQYDRSERVYTYRGICW